MLRGLGPSQWTLALRPNKSQAAENLVLPGPRKLGLGLMHSWHHPGPSKHRAEEYKGKVLTSPWSRGSGVKLWDLAHGGVTDCPDVCDREIQHTWTCMLLYGKGLMTFLFHV